MNPDRASELAKTIRLASEISPPDRVRCDRCLRMVESGTVFEGRCLPCSEAARDEVSQATLRKQAFERDKGKCMSCGTDTEAERVEIEQMRGWLANPTTPEHAHFAKNRLDYYRGQRGYLDSEIAGERSLWEAHHVSEKARGGANVIGNIATVCSPCHARLTGDFSRIRKVARKPRGRFGR